MSDEFRNGGRSVEAGKTANIIYILYLASIVFGLTILIGVVMAYINRGEGPEWVETHYQFQIRTFWISLLLGILCVVTMPIFIGFLLAIFAVIWLIIRCAKGMKYLAREEPHPDPATWMFG